MNIETILKNAIQRLVGWKVTKLKVVYGVLLDKKGLYFYEVVATTNGCKNRYSVSLDMWFPHNKPVAVYIRKED